MGMQKRMVFVEVRRVRPSGHITTVMIDKSGASTGEVLGLHLRQGCFIGYNGKRATFRGNTRRRRHSNVHERVLPPEVGDTLIVELFVDEAGNIKPKPRWGNANRWRAAIYRLQKKRRSAKPAKYVHRPTAVRPQQTAAQLAAIRQ